MKSSKLAEQVICWWKNKWNRWFELFEWNKNTMMNWHSNESSFDRDDTNFDENSNFSVIWMKDQSFLLMIVESRKNIIEWFIFEWILIANEMNDWLRSTRQIERTIKSSIETTTTMMNSWHFVIVCYIKNWYVKKQYEWCRLVYKSSVDDAIICYAWNEDWII